MGAERMVTYHAALLQLALQAWTHMVRLQHCLEVFRRNLKLAFYHLF